MINILIRFFLCLKSCFFSFYTVLFTGDTSTVAAGPAFAAKAARIINLVPKYRCHFWRSFCFYHCLSVSRKTPVLYGRFLTKFGESVYYEPDKRRID